MKRITTIILLNFIFSQFSLKLIADDFDKPIYATSNKNFPDLIYVVEQSGIIWTVDNNKISEEPFIDILDRVHQPLFPADERGLLGCAFDDNSKYIYLNYIDKNNHTVISRFLINQNKAVKETENIIITIKQPYSNHNGGSISFGLDGYLYISIGDGGSAGDPENRAQDTSNFFGSILRIKMNKDGTYSIPKDNPFYLSKNNKEEIWSYGLRNVWRFSFDRLTGNLFMGDVGQNSWEEINFQSSQGLGGSNYGWNFMEGNHSYLDIAQEKNNFINPIFEYPNDANYIKTILGIKQKKVNGCSVTGGYVYRGKNVPKLYGRYIFGDYCTGRVWSFLYKNNTLSKFEDLTDILLNSINEKSFYLSSFGETSSGELLIVDYSGKVYLLTAEIN